MSVTQQVYVIKNHIGVIHKPIFWSEINIDWIKEGAQSRTEAENVWGVSSFPLIG